MFKEPFETQAITATILCPSCNETLLFGDTKCRFCQTTIDQRYAKESAEAQVFVTNAVKSANLIRTLRYLLYILLAITVFSFFFDPTNLRVLLLFSVLTLSGPIGWLRKYRHASDHPEVVKAAKDVRIELYLWLVGIALQTTALLVSLFYR
ncbi:MAG TPA: hypothetical protein VGD61_07910 [Pyrinomonadaceae bacterium]